MFTSSAAKTGRRRASTAKKSEDELIVDRVPNLIDGSISSGPISTGPDGDQNNKKKLANPFAPKINNLGKDGQTTEQGSMLETKSRENEGDGGSPECVTPNHTDIGTSLGQVTTKGNECHDKYIGRGSPPNERGGSRPSQERGDSFVAIKYPSMLTTLAVMLNYDIHNLYEFMMAVLNVTKELNDPNVLVERAVFDAMQYSRSRGIGDRESYSMFCYMIHGYASLMRLAEEPWSDGVSSNESEIHIKASDMKKSVGVTLTVKPNSLWVCNKNDFARLICIFTLPDDIIAFLRTDGEDCYGGSNIYVGLDISKPPYIPLRDVEEP
uniref:p9 n=1 Tax=Rice gall dwarf virus TaxID=10986 RepID=E6Y0A6_RGDV|nr:p9 [Rice gall dwarf virus]